MKDKVYWVIKQDDGYFHEYNLYTGAQWCLLNWAWLFPTKQSAIGMITRYSLESCKVVKVSRITELV